ncbi:hypothetical protein [Massilia sp. METH4]
MEKEEEFLVEQYERKGTSAMPYIVLAALVAVVGLIAGLAAWTGA